MNLKIDVLNFRISKDGPQHWRQNNFSFKVTLKNSFQTGWLFLNLSLDNRDGTW